MTKRAPLHEETIRYTADNLCVVGDTDARVMTGDLGRYLGPAPDEGWHLTEAAKYPGKVCPVSLDMIEVA